MSPPAHWTQMDSPVKPANDEGAGRGRGPVLRYAHHPTVVTRRLDRRVHGTACSLDADGVAGQAGE